MSDLRAYLQQEYPEFRFNDADFALQETLRRLDAVIFDCDRGLVTTGKHALACIRILLPREEKTLSAEFVAFVKRELEDVDDGSANVRGHVKRIWMYPLTKFLPWREIHHPALERRISQLLQQITPALTIRDGKVYLVLGDITQQLWKTDISGIIPGLCLKINKEPSHITLVNSDVVAQIDSKQLADFVEKYREVKVSCTSLASTVSLDWSLFSVCVVARFQSKELDAFVNHFNRAFGTKIQPAFHTTFAVLPR